MIWPALCVSLAALAYYVHTRCVRALGANTVDHVVQLHEPSSSPPSGDAPVQPLSPPLLLVVLGWGGSTRKQLRRIVEFATNVLQVPTISYINPMLQFLYGSADDSALTQLLSRIDTELAANPQLAGFALLVHSNNGAFVFAEMKRRMAEPNSPWAHLQHKLRGVVFDSAPGVFAADGSNGATMDAARAEQEQRDNPLVLAKRALVACFHFSLPCVAIVLNRPVYLHPFWTPALTLWAFGFLTFVRVCGVRSAKGAPRKKVGDVRRMLRLQMLQDIPRVPHLFLYSHKDRLVTSDRIEPYIDCVRATLGSDVPVVAHDFKVTAHVQHFLRANQEYAERLHDFLAMCVKK